jgi:hypothetical protein
MVELKGLADAGPAPSGTLAVRWTVVGEEVTSVEVLSAFPGASERFTRCVTDSIRDWRFPKTKGGGPAVITYPFVFRLPADAGRP